MSKVISEFSDEIELDDDDVIDVIIQYEYNHVIDYNYGADADNNRGCTKHFIEDISFKIITNNSIDITDQVICKSADEYARILDRCEEEANKMIGE